MRPVPHVRAQDEEDGHDLRDRRDLARPARRELPLPAGEDHQQGDEEQEEVPGEHHHGQPDGDLDASRVGRDGEKEVRRDQQQLVGDRIEVGAEGRLHVEMARQVAVDAVGNPGHHEDRQGDAEAAVGDGDQEERERREPEEGDEVGKGPGTPQRRLHSFSRAPAGTSAGTQTIDPLVRMSLRVLELLEHPGHGLPGRADRVGDLLVGRPGHDEVALDGRLPGLVGEADQVARQAAAHVQQRHRLDDFVGLAQPGRERLEDLARQREVPLEHGEELRPREDGELAVRQRCRPTRSASRPRGGPSRRKSRRPAGATARPPGRRANRRRL